jgi:tRNA 2-thiouridine synthesizing protein A
VPATQADGGRRTGAKESLMNAQWDAGEIGCGHLVFELSRRVNQMRPGERLEIIARDPGAASDLPAWCRMTGHTLVSSNHPTYVIECRMA